MKNDSTTNLAMAGVLIATATALGLSGITLMQRSHSDSAGLRWSVRFILVGLLLFSGSIYAMTFGAPRFLGMVAPIGGTSLMIAWVVFAITCWRLRLPSTNP